MHSYRHDLSLDALWEDHKRRTGRSTLLPGERRVVLRFAELITEFLTNRWPRGSGQSADAWRAIPLPDGIGYRIANPHGYVAHVHRKGEQGGLLVEELIESLRVYLPGPLSSALQVEARLTEGHSPPPVTVQPARPALRVVSGGRHG